MVEKNRDKWNYPEIDAKKSGAELKRLVRKAGLTVKDLQCFLHLSCPQPIYRWYRGLAMPSVDHLYAIARLLGVHMEELLMERPETAMESLNTVCWECVPDHGNMEKRVLLYLEKLSKVS